MMFLAVLMVASMMTGQQSKEVMPNETGRQYNRTDQSNSAVAGDAHPPKHAPIKNKLKNKIVVYNCVRVGESYRCHDPKRNGALFRLRADSVKVIIEVEKHAKRNNY